MESLVSLFSFEYLYNHGMDFQGRYPNNDETAISLLFE